MSGTRDMIVNGEGGSDIMQRGGGFKHLLIHNWKARTYTEEDVQPGAQKYDPELGDGPDELSGSQER